ncbi:MAG TPA: GspMb/PilO family protein [Vicinamibacterales bacterium]|nr:GspMb/PilO family protein [Vicinamibacterales bacterium]
MSLTARIFRERRRVIIPLLVFLLANAAGLGYVFWLQQSMDAAQASRDKALADLTLARKAKKDAEGQKGSKDLADVEIRKFYDEILPKNLPAALNVLNFWLSKVAATSRVSYRAGSYDHDPVRDSRLTKVKGEITLSGDYANVRRFLYELETSQEFIVIEKVQLSQPNAAAQGNSQLEVALTVATYYLTEPLPGAVK